jgi:hypothetical protein
MLLKQARIIHFGPFQDLTFPFADESDPPQLITVIQGGGGVGKTTLLTAIAGTRPGHAAIPMRPRKTSLDPAPTIVTDWNLGDDDPNRPHSLRVATPNAQLEETEEISLLRRREQTMFDRKASEGGFVLVPFSGARWFSRTPVVLSSPERNVFRYDVRATSNFDDATRADLTRETKQALSYIAIRSALEHQSEPSLSWSNSLFRICKRVLDNLIGLGGFQFRGADPETLEPTFVNDEEASVLFDDLPTHIKHLVAFGALTLRALIAAYPDSDPVHNEGVVLIDNLDLHQPWSIHRSLPQALRAALPKVQWIVTTSSTEVGLGCDPNQVLALRRTSTAGQVELYEGELAVVH